MTAYETILKRRSIRKFTDKQISDEIIDTLLKAAMAGPSACNKQPWEFYVIKSKDLREKLKKATRYTKMDSSLVIIVAGNKERFMPKELNEFWMHDCGSAVENILLTATEHDIGSCWCGLYPMEDSAKNVREILELGDNIVPMALIHLGYTEEEFVPRTQYDEKYVHRF